MPTFACRCAIGSREVRLAQATLADSAHVGGLFVGYVLSYVVDVAGTSTPSQRTSIDLADEPRVLGSFFRPSR